MKAPVKPEKPNKPIQPNKDQKTYNHPIDISKRFLVELFYDNDGNELPPYKWDVASDRESQEYTPSLKSLIDLVPTGIAMENIFIKLDLGYESKNNYSFRPFKGANIFYTTPYDYKKELDIYNSNLLKYEDYLVDYNKKMIKYKKEMEEYKEFKEKVRIKKKRTLLEKQLKDLR